MMLAEILVTPAVLLVFAVIALRCLACGGAALPAFAGNIPEMQEEQPPDTTKNERRVFFCALALRLGLFLAAVACVAMHTGVFTLENLLLYMTRWDSPHYIQLVEKGYAGYMENGQHLFLVFYPLYVWLVRGVRLLVPNTIVAGMLVSWVCYAAGCSQVYRIAARLYGHSVGKNTVLLLSFFPWSFFFGTVMTEGLFLLTTAAACCAALEHRWGRYAFWGTLSGMTRMTGVLVLVPAGVELLRQTQLFSKEKPWFPRFKAFLWKIPAVFAPLLGLGVYLLLNWKIDGDPFAFVRHQKHWHQGGMWIGSVVRYLLENAAANWNRSIGWAIWLPEVLLFVGFFAVLAAALVKKLHPGLLAFAFCYFVANYSLSWLLSAGRYLSCGFALFILLAVLLEKHPQLRTAVLGAGAICLGLYMFAWVAGAQIM